LVVITSKYRKSLKYTLGHFQELEG